MLGLAEEAGDQVHEEPQQAQDGPLLPRRRWWSYPSTCQAEAREPTFLCGEPSLGETKPVPEEAASSWSSETAPANGEVPQTASSVLAPEIENGTLCFVTLPPTAEPDSPIAVFASCSSRERIGTLHVGQYVVASGPPEEVDGHTMVPLRPSGAVDYSSLRLEPLRRSSRVSSRIERRLPTLSEAKVAAAVHIASSRSFGSFDPPEDLPGERALVTAQGMSGCTPGTAVADLVVPSASDMPIPVQVDVTNYRLRLTGPDNTGATLKVLVCSGQGLVVKERSGPPDPCALVSLTGPHHRSMVHARQTTVKNKTHDPVWNEAFEFEGVDEQNNVRVQLFDSARIRGEDYIGEVNVRKAIRAALLQNPRGSTSFNGKQWAMSLPVQYGDLDLDSIGDAPRLGSLRLLLRCTWPTPGSTRGHSSVPLMCIEKVHLDSKTKRLSLFTKATEQFWIHFDNAKDAVDIHGALTSQPETIESLLCLSGHKSKLPSHVFRFDAHRELERWTTQKAGSTRRASPDGYDHRWRVDGEVNRDYKLCSTYPQEVTVPSALPTGTLRACAAFRTRHRFPMIAWVHPCNGAVIVRCSQPMVGSNLNTGSSAKHDHECLMAFASGDTRELTILDARPYKNAQANRVGGGGTETSLSYQSCNVQFLDIENIHVMREALHGLRAAVCQQDDYGMYAGALTKWLNHLRSLIRGASSAAELVESGTSVVVHCSDGWDRTSQLVSLASILLDGHYRTIKGLIALVQKDWLLPGHRFRDRCGLASRKEQIQHQHEFSPIFLQFFDALSQVWNTYPRHFEYTPQLLAFVLYHSLSGRYSNFLGNCEKEREEAGFVEIGNCLWAEIVESEQLWLNPSYDEDLGREPIVPCVIPLHQHGFSRELYVGFSAWWTPETTNHESSFMRGLSTASSDPPPIRTSRRQNCTQQTNGGYIFCATGLHGICVSRMLACELLLRKFAGVSTFSPQPIVKVVSHVSHLHYTQFVIEMTSNTGEEMHYVTKRYTEFDALRLALLEQVGLEASVPFPPKMFFGQRCKGRRLEDRLAKLNTWFRTIVAMAWVLPEDHSIVKVERCCESWVRLCQSFLPDADRWRRPSRSPSCDSLELSWHCTNN